MANTTDMIKEKSVKLSTNKALANGNKAYFVL